MRRVLSALVSPFSQTRGVARWMLVVGAAITAVFVIFAFFAPWIAPYGFAQFQDSGGRFPKLGHPDNAHWFGTTDLETDVLSRVIWGARTALEVVSLAVLASLLIGLVLGIVSGYVGGWVDRILVLIMDSLYAFPSFLLAIVCAFLFTNIIGTNILFLTSGVVAASLSLTVIYIPQYFRVVRNTTLSAKQATYVEAARALGASGGTVMRRYLFGNVIQSVPVIATLNAADAILTLAGLGFLGIGIQPDQAAEWGYDLQRSLDDAGVGVWWTSLYPGLAIVLLVTGLTLVGEGLNETINPILRRRRLLPVVLPSREKSSSAPARRASPELEADS
ncbi:MAG: peptide/nickel transport system permease protein [Nocardioidaceae bacterium]|nr:peptide/nickel transport system permease protein [Nocardioidaceae bacterium]